jgi:biopolymer transport protein ExbD
MRRRGRNRSDLPLTADINVTSLVDVAFTLLVVFIIIAPALQGGIEVQMPEADVAPITTSDAPIIITLTREGRVFMEDTPMEIAEFRSAFPGLVEATARDQVYLRSDANASVEQFLQVLGILESTGVNTTVMADDRGEG